MKGDRCPSLALFGRANRANQCPVSGVKQPCRRNLMTAEVDPTETLATKFAVMHNAGIPYDDMVACDIRAEGAHEVWSSFVHSSIRVAEGARGPASFLTSSVQHA
jgi:hypothetical protein